MAESSRRYNLRDTRKKPQGVLLKQWEMEYSKLISNENRRIPLETVKTAIRSAFEDGIFEQWRITLKCPLSGQRIKVPTRYADCTHIECFDLETFLRMKTQKNIRVCPICQKEIEKPLSNLRIDKYIETVLSTMPDAMQVELLPDGSFTKVHEELVVVPNVINDEEPFVQDSNTSSFDIKQEDLVNDDEYITLSDGEEESIEEITIVDMKPISLMPLNMDIKPKITSTSEPEQIHSGEDRELQDEHNAAAQTANISRKNRNFSGNENDESETVTTENDQNCSTDSATTIQSNVKTEPVDVDTSEAESFGITEMRKRKALSTPDVHISHRSEENAQHNAKEKGESSELRELEHIGNKWRRECKFFFRSGKGCRKGMQCLYSHTVTNLANARNVLSPDVIKVTGEHVLESGRYNQSTSNAQSRTIDGIPFWKQHLNGSANVDPAKVLGFHSTRDQEKRNSTVANLTNRIHVFGPCLHPTEANRRDLQRDFIRTYFGHFGIIINVSVTIFDNLMTDSLVTFSRCESAAKCIEQRNHKIIGHNFSVQGGQPSKDANWKIMANPVQNVLHPQSGNTPVPNYQRKLPADVTNKFTVNDHCLHSEQLDPTAYQKGDLQTYMSQFGATVNDNATPNNWNYLRAESSHRNQWSQSTTSGSSQIHGSVMDCSTNSGEWPQSHGFARFEKRNSALTKAETVAKCVTNNQTKLPANSTNRIWVVGPCLHPEEENLRSSQKKELRTYFSQFGKIITITVKRMNADMRIKSRVGFHNCDIAAKCIQQRKHKICGRDFIASAASPTKSIKKKLGANLVQKMPVPSHENTRQIFRVFHQQSQMSGFNVLKRQHQFQHIISDYNEYC